MVEVLVGIKMLIQNNLGKKKNLSGKKKKINGRPKRKKTKMEDDQNGRQPKWKKCSQRSEFECGPA